MDLGCILPAGSSLAAAAVSAVVAQTAGMACRVVVRSLAAAAVSAVVACVVEMACRIVAVVSGVGNRLGIGGGLGFGEGTGCDNWVVHAPIA